MPLTRLTCIGCGASPTPKDRAPFRCTHHKEGDNIDHVLREAFRAAPKNLDRTFETEEMNPFLKYRTLFHSYHTAIDWGLTDNDYVSIVEDLDKSVSAVVGKGFRATPFATSPKLASALQMKGDSTVWIKDETGNVSGSHKARHLIGIMLWMNVLERAFSKEVETDARLAIASCGNAALAAAVVAKAAERKLEVFVPLNANRSVLDQLRTYGAEIIPCPRSVTVAGDPCYLRFREEIKRNALPFTCQGNENGLTISGGKTLAFEMISTLIREKRPLDRLFLQVGGGALASACIQAFQEAETFGLIDRIPKFHAVQAEGSYPLVRAYRMLSERTEPNANDKLRYAATHRSEFMWPWESTPTSIAEGILDDETYDWFAVVEGMLLSGGSPIVASERELAEARRLAQESTGIPADATGTSGLAGLLQLQNSGEIGANETVAVLFTGVER